MDPALGSKKLQAVVDLFHDSPDATTQSRECLLLAQKQLARLDQLAAAQSRSDRAVIVKQLVRAAAIAAENPDEAARIRLAIIELYADESWAADAVAQARRALESTPSGIATQKQP